MDAPNENDMASMLTHQMWMWDEVVDKDFCRYVLSKINWEESLEGSLIADKAEDHEHRKTRVVWCNPYEPIGAVLQAFILEANRAAGWNYDLTHFEHIQLGRYENSGHYDWHMDVVKPDENGSQRKLSAVMLLNDSDEYEGGHLEVEGYEGNVLLKAGNLIVFPSFVKHRVTPVTKGVRYSAVCWCHGPAFK